MTSLTGLAGELQAVGAVGGLQAWSAIMTFPPLDPEPKDVPTPPDSEPDELPQRDEDPFQFPPDMEPIEPLDPDDEPEDQAPRPPPV